MLNVGMFRNSILVNFISASVGVSSVAFHPDHSDLSLESHEPPYVLYEAELDNLWTQRIVWGRHALYTPHL